MAIRKRSIIISIPTVSNTQRKRVEAILDYTKTKPGDKWRLYLDSVGMTPLELRRRSH